MPRPKPSPRATQAADPQALVARLRAGERSAISRVITELERLSPLAPQLLRAMQRHLGRALVLGFTGPPGAGKSTLINAYIGHVRGQGKTVGIIAVDPSSPVSGGAILADRIRMTAALQDEGVFIRSLASRGHLGGLSPAAVRVIDALDAAGKDLIVLETVGTGQADIDVAEVADVRILVTAPGLGDDIQAMKSGLLEIADILVVNKADREGVERTFLELRSALSLRPATRPKTPVLKTTATTGEGVQDLAAAIIKIAAARADADPAERRRRRARYLIARAAADLTAERIRASSGSRLDRLADDVLSGRLLPAEAAEKLLRS
jgi:LAO/AO transport system kinase